MLPCSTSMRSCDHLLHDPAAGRLQRPHAAPGQEPHAFVFVTAVNNVDAITSDRVMECGASIFGNESEESLAPWVIRIMENLFAKLFQFFNAGRTNGFGDCFAALLVEALKIEFFEWHRFRLFCRKWFVRQWKRYRSAVTAGASIILVGDGTCPIKRSVRMHRAISFFNRVRPSSPWDFSPISDCKRFVETESWCHETAPSRNPSQPTALAAYLCSHRASSGKTQPRSAHATFRSFGARDFAVGCSAESRDGICRGEDGRFGGRSA